ncbi:MAG: response regulator transcription factor [Actinomycetia bacterium]|nr:response regulator transcription factor [Actinomycetes bacterium]
MITVMLVDDHPIVRQGLVGVLSLEDDIEIVGEAADGETALAIAPRLRPDVIIMDLRLPGISGSKATQQILAQAEADGTDWAPHIIVLTTYEDDDSITAAIESGATGYLLKSASSDELVAAIRATSQGRSILAPSVAAALVRQVKRSSNARLISAREAEVLSLMAEGLNTAQMAERLYVEQSTVKTHVEHILTKLGVSSRLQALAKARELGLLG